MGGFIDTANVSTVFISNYILLTYKEAKLSYLKKHKMNIDDGGMHSCDATDEAITQTFVYVDEN